MNESGDRDPDYIVDAVESTEITLVETEEDLQYKKVNEKRFNPQFMHQIFKKDEEIYGYKNLKIDIFLSAALLHPYIKIEYSDKLKDADNIHKHIEWVFKNGYTRNKMDFL
jgi:histone acetyltransferase 1